MKKQKNPISSPSFTFEGFQEKKKQVSTSTYATKQGQWTPSQKEKIFELIQKAAETYTNSLDNQINFLHFNLQGLFGRRMQIFIFQKMGIEGHALYAYNSKYMEIQHKAFTYLIWKVKLIEDLPEDKEY